MKFLIVDDSPTMRAIIARTLKTLNYTDFLEAGDGKEALDQLSAHSVDMVITDWNMPNMNGLELVENLRSGDHKDLPILMVTTNGARADVVEALRVGVNNYVIKPMTPHILQEKISELLPHA